jgi:hypothetical protein
MFRSAENLRLAADMRALQRVAAPWREARTTWFDGTPESIEGRLAATERVLTYARGGVTQAHIALEREASIARAELKEAAHRLMVDFLDDGARAFKGSKRVAEADDEYPDGGSYGKLCNKDGCVARHVSGSGWCKTHDPKNRESSRRVAGKHDADPDAPWKNKATGEDTTTEHWEKNLPPWDEDYEGKHRESSYRVAGTSKYAPGGKLDRERKAQEQAVLHKKIDDAFSGWQSRVHPSYHDTFDNAYENFHDDTVGTDSYSDLFGDDDTRNAVYDHLQSKYPFTSPRQAGRVKQADRPYGSEYSCDRCRDHVPDGAGHYLDDEDFDDGSGDRLCADCFGKARDDHALEMAENWSPDDKQDPFDPRMLGASRRMAGDGDPMLDHQNAMDSARGDQDYRDFMHQHLKDTGPGVGDEHVCDHCGLISEPHDVYEEGRCPDCGKATDDPHDPLPDYMQPDYRRPQFGENKHEHWEDMLMGDDSLGMPQDGPGRHRSGAARRRYAEDGTTAPTTPLVPQTGTQAAQPATGSLPKMHKSQPSTGDMGTQKVNPGTSFAPEPSPSGGSDPDAFKADPVGPRDIPAINTDIEINSADGIGYWSNGMPKEPVRSGVDGLMDKFFGQPNQPSNFDHSRSGMGGPEIRPGYKEGPGYQPGEAYYPNTMPTASRRNAAPMASPGEGGSAIAPVEMGGAASASIPGAIGKMLSNGSTMTGQEPSVTFNAGPGVTPKISAASLPDFDDSLLFGD